MGIAVQSGACIPVPKLLRDQQGGRNALRSARPSTTRRQSDFPRHTGDVARMASQTRSEAVDLSAPLARKVTSRQPTLIDALRARGYSFDGL
jgi:hypothetical protein